MTRFGFVTFQHKYAAQVERFVSEALESEFLLFDTAASDGNCRFSVVCGI